MTPVRNPPIASLLILLVAVILFVPAGAENVAGISAGPAKACPTAGCTCMPESQAETLGYVRCSVNDTPCFQDSFGRPLYCYGPVSCDSPSECDITRSGSRAGPAGTGGITLVITMQTPAVEDTSCAGINGNLCTVPAAETTTQAPETTDPITAVVNFIASLFGMK